MGAGRKKLYTKAELLKLLPKIEEWGREGCIDSEIAKRLGISLSTLYAYKRDIPEFDEAIKRAKVEADFVIKESLFNKAKGFYYDEIEEILDENGSLLRKKITRKFSVPSDKAILTWLQNREPEEWREKKDVVVEAETLIEVSLVGEEEDEE